MKKLLSILIVSTVISSCLPQDVQVPQSPLLPILERKSGLIAYIGIDGNVYLTDQSGRNPDAITDDAKLPDDQSSEFHFYQNLTWSLDGSRLAFVSASGNEGSQTNSEMHIKNVEQDSISTVFTSENEFPIYLYWSPDNNNISFLSTSPAGQSLILQSISVNDGKRTMLDAGSPYYWSWAPDGNTMIVHTGSGVSTTPEHLAFLQLDTDIIEDGLDSIPASFQAPAWSPDGNRILLARVSNETSREIVMLKSNGEFEMTIAEFDRNTAFAWSPDSELIAYIDGNQTLDAGVIGTMHVYDTNTGEDFFQADDIFAFFWSPDNRKLAYFRPLVVQADDSASQQRFLLQLNMLDVISGESKELFTFQPTGQFSAILPYFDQYHQSATIWSPDSNNLVLSFLDQEGNPGIAVVAPSGQLEPRILAEGFIAFWSWK